MTKLTPTELAKEAQKAYYSVADSSLNPDTPDIDTRSWLAVGEWIASLLPKENPKSETVAVQHMCNKDGACAGCGGPTKLVFSVGEVRMRACCKQCAVKAIKERM